MINHFIGTEKAIKAKKRTEQVLKVVTFPLWIPWYLVMMICYWISEFIENVLFYIFDDISDSISTFIARKFFNK